MYIHNKSISRKRYENRDLCDVWNEKKIKIYELLCVAGKQLL